MYKRKGAKRLRKKIIFPVVTLLALTAAFFGATNVFADDMTDPQTTLVEKIASKFGLNKNEVQKVFDEARSEHQTQMQVKMEERLSTLVSEGKITEEQKNLILNKHKVLQSQRE